MNDTEKRTSVFVISRQLNNVTTVRFIAAELICQLFLEITLLRVAKGTLHVTTLICVYISVPTLVPFKILFYFTNELIVCIL